MDINFEGQSWLVDVRSQASQIVADRLAKDERHNLEMIKQKQEDDQKVLEAIRKSKDGLYQAQIEKLTRFSRQKAWHILYGLREASRITEIEGRTKQNKKVKMYKLAETPVAKTKSEPAKPTAANTKPKPAKPTPAKTASKQAKPARTKPKSQAKRLQPKSGTSSGKSKVRSVGKPRHVDAK